MLLKRVLSAILGIPILIYLVYEGKYLFLISIIFLTCAAINELRQIFMRTNIKTRPFLIYGGGILFPLLAYFAPSGQEGELIFTGFTVFLLFHLVALLLCFSQYSVRDLGLSFLGSCYIGFLLSYLILIRKMNSLGFQNVFFVLILTWASDTGAYFSGRFLGHRPFWCKLSPKKTIEGALGGLISSVGAAFLFQLFYPLFFSYLDAIILGILVGIFAQAGDLVESAFKRLGKVKNSGELIPGHGGILDRFDSLLFSAPIAYFYFKFLFSR